MITGGKIGELFATLAFSAALVSAIAFFFAEYREGKEKNGWQKIGTVSFLLHASGILGMIGTLFYLIATHQYQYHYVWAHSSNDLPVYFMISCFWEGQEGSFLLWEFWHSVLGLILLTVLKDWKNPVMMVIASVQMILASMVLGVYVSGQIAGILFCLATAAPALWLLFEKIKENKLGGYNGLLTSFSLLAALFTIGLIATGNSGYFSAFKSGAYSGKEFLIFSGIILLGFAAIAWYFFTLVSSIRKPDFAFRHTGREFLAALFSLGFFVLAAWVGLTPWKIGSTPFMLLRDAMDNAPVFVLNPDFVPANGNGLNPLLQNYWMVIHPPTLFLGFASTLVPFAFVVSGLLRKDFTGWIRPASPWMTFSAMILGVGIIMGGYWAYETLSFGGYWNWDPVENASFVPWLTGIAAIHGILAWRKSKSFLAFSMSLVILTFILVLYSTFLTRSSILGEASVHAFTDLGLSGQLLLLLFVFFFPVALLYFWRLPQIPEEKREINFLSQEFFLFLGTLVLIFSSIGISLATSLPVINKIFGSNLAPPAELQFFYYRWNIWFAIFFGVLSGVGQYLFWRRIEKKELGKALFRPFLLAILSASVIVILIAYFRMTFTYEDEFRSWLDIANVSENWITKISKFLQYGFYGFTDEILLVTALFTVFANGDILQQLIRKKESSFRTLGGSFAHIGFGLMLIGFLFSSGYDTIVTKNINPNELSRFDEKDRIDNILLVKNRPRFVNGYEVTYLGKKDAVPPVTDIRILDRENKKFRFSFRDSTNELYAMELDNENFLFRNENGNQVLDTGFLRTYLNDRVTFIRPKLINSRSLYAIRFIPMVTNSVLAELDSNSQFILYPEAEINKGMGLIAHPSRKIMWSRDLYVHVSSIPQEDKEPRYNNYMLSLGLGDTLEFAQGKLHLLKVQPEEGKSEYELVAFADIEIIMGDTVVPLSPKFRVTKSGEIHPGTAYDEKTRSLVTFLEVNPETGKMLFSVQVEENPKDDFIVLKGIHKPYINVLWLGTLVLVIGFTLSIFRRVKEI